MTLRISYVLCLNAACPLGYFRNTTLILTCIYYLLTIFIEPFFQFIFLKILFEIPFLVIFFCLLLQYLIAF